MPGYPFWFEAGKIADGPGKPADDARAISLQPSNSGLTPLGLHGLLCCSYNPSGGVISNSYEVMRTSVRSMIGGSS